jgi:hypothetical protein
VDFSQGELLRVSLTKFAATEYYYDYSTSLLVSSAVSNLSDLLVSRDKTKRNKELTLSPWLSMKYGSINNQDLKPNEEWKLNVKKE